MTSIPNTIEWDKMKSKNIMIGVGTLIGILLFSKKSNASNMENNRNIHLPTSNFQMRGCDPKGCGHYGASRGSRKHNGIDVVVKKGQNIYSPITGYISRYPFPYASDLSYKGIEIIGEGEHKGYKVKIFYCSPTVARNTKVSKGQKIAIAQAINEKYGPDMINHIHVEMYKNNTRLNPEIYLKA